MNIIGEGSYGRVHMRGECAVKEFKSRDFTAFREIAIVSLLDHENIIKWKRVNFSPLGVVMERYDRDLNSVRVAGHDIFRQIASGLAYMHRRGFIHADIKPANILVRGNSVVIADFGISRPLSARQTSCTQSEGYRAPEVAGGEIGPPIDCWSLGVIMRNYGHKSAFLDPNPSTRMTCEEYLDRSPAAFPAFIPVDRASCDLAKYLNLANCPQEVIDMAEGLFRRAEQRRGTAEVSYFLAAAMYGVSIDYSPRKKDLAGVLHLQF
jgi:serine/threonine protein kinase